MNLKPYPLTTKARLCICIHIVAEYATFGGDILFNVILYHTFEF